MSKEKLTIKHLAPYLPYKLKGVFINDMSEYFSDDFSIDFSKGSIWTYCGFVDEDLEIPLGEGEINGALIRKGNFYTSVGAQLKPILRPLSDLEENIFIESQSEFNFRPVEKFKNVIEGWCDQYDEWWNLQYPMYSNMMINCPYEVMCKLLEWHFDVFGLIEKGLAISYNSLKND